MIPEQRLREIARIVSQGHTASHDYSEFVSACAELLAARETIARVTRERDGLRHDHDMAEGEADHVLDGEWFADLCDAIRMLRIQRDESRAKNERLAKQMTAMDRKRQALAEACVEAAEWLARRASMPSCECDPSDLAKRMLAAIAEQPKPAGGGA